MFFTSLDSRPSFSFPPRRRENDNDPPIDVAVDVSVNNVTNGNDDCELVSPTRLSSATQKYPAVIQQEKLIQQSDFNDEPSGVAGEEDEDEDAKEDEQGEEQVSQAHTLIGGKGARRRRKQQQRVTESNRQSRLERALYAEQTVQENLTNQGFDPKKSFLPKDRQVKLQTGTTASLSTSTSTSTGLDVHDFEDHDDDDSKSSGSSSSSNSSDDGDDDGGDNLESLTQAELDTLYANDMYELSLKEREQILQEIHGIVNSNPSSVPHSPSAFPGAGNNNSSNNKSNDNDNDSGALSKREIHRARCELQYHLAKLSKQYGTASKETTKRKKPKYSVEAYQTALQQDFNYVTCENFQMAFLRADGLSKPDKAAIRMIQFFQLKQELFGTAKLTKDITISDIYAMSKDDKKSLESGFFQLLPVRDVAGRAILCGQPPLLSYKHLDNVARTFYYMVMTALQDESTQKAGFVLVGFNAGPKKVMDRSAAWTVSRLKQILPMKVAALHFNYDDYKIRPMMSLAMLVMGRAGRVRFRAHYGITKENLYKLSTFGIPSTNLPITTDGEAKVKYHRTWLKSRKRLEDEQQRQWLKQRSTQTAITMGGGKRRQQQQQQQTVIVVPGRLDILLGRGKPIQEHYGNLRYHALLDYYQQSYEQSKKFEKMQIAQRIVDTVYGYGGRFLKQNHVGGSNSSGATAAAAAAAAGSGWTPVDDLVARDKVSHAFRTRRTSQGTVTTAAAVAAASPSPAPYPSTMTSSSSSSPSPAPSTTSTSRKDGRRVRKFTVNNRNSNNVNLAGLQQQQQPSSTMTTATTAATPTQQEQLFSRYRKRRISTEDDGPSHLAAAAATTGRTRAATATVTTTNTQIVEEETAIPWPVPSDDQATANQSKATSHNKNKSSTTMSSFHDNAKVLSSNQQNVNNNVATNVKKRNNNTINNGEGNDDNNYIIEVTDEEEGNIDEEHEQILTLGRTDVTNKTANNNTAINNNNGGSNSSLMTTTMTLEPFDDSLLSMNMDDVDTDALFCGLNGSSIGSGF